MLNELLYTEKWRKTVLRGQRKRPGYAGHDARLDKLPRYLSKACGNTAKAGKMHYL
jgi:hypothetical protein